MAATGLLMEASWKGVPDVTGGPPILVTPKPLVHSMLTPGTCSAAMRSDRLVSRTGSPF